MPQLNLSVHTVRGLHGVTIAAIVGYCVLHFAVLWLHRVNSQPFSLNNFIHTGTFRFVLAFDALVFTPLKEEFLYRIVIFNFFLSRNPNSPAICVLYTSFVFSAYHLMNTMSGRFSIGYVLLQVRFVSCHGLRLTCPGVLLVLYWRILWPPIRNEEEHLGAIVAAHAQQFVCIACTARPANFVDVARVSSEWYAS